MFDRRLPAQLPQAGGDERVAGLSTAEVSDVVECDAGAPLERQCWFKGGADADFFVSAVDASMDGDSAVVELVTKFPNETRRRGVPYRWVSEGASRYHLERRDGEWRVVRVVGLWVS